MLADVVQCFLGDPVQAQRDVGLDRGDVGDGVTRDGDAMEFAKLRAQRVHRRHESGMLQQAGMQVVRDVPDLLRQRRGVALDGAERGDDGLVVDASEQLALEAAHRYGQGGNPLADVIMQIARDARALGFLRGDQPAEQLGDLAVAGLVFTGERLAFAVPAFASINVVLAGAWLGVVVLLNRQMRQGAQSLLEKDRP